MHLFRLAAAAMAAASAAAAQAAAPVIENNAGAARWLESQALHTGGGGNAATVTLVVRHDIGRRITGIAFDADYDGTDDTGSVGIVSVAPQHPGGGYPRSRVTVTRALPVPGGFTCPVVGSAVRRQDLPLRVAVIDDTGQRSASVSATVRWHEANACTSADDFPRLVSVSGGSNDVPPFQNVTFGFTADDPDSSGSDDRADALLWRWRRLNDGAVSSTVEVDAEDNTARVLAVGFGQRGRYVVEGQIRGEDGTVDGAWWRIGSVDVNSAGAPALSLNAPSIVDVGDTLTLQAMVGSDPDQTGLAQMIEWDLDGNGTFEVLAYSANASTALSAAQRQQAVNTGLPGLRTLRARVTDNGALDAADTIRRTESVALQVRINAVPTASSASHATDEDTPLTFSLQGDDADDAPSPLAFQPFTSPAHGQLACSGALCTYTPDPDFSGIDGFQFRTHDGFANSPGATVTITVNAVPDLPVAQAATQAAREDTALDFTLAATDPDSGFNFVTPATTANGTLDCAPDGVCHYTPSADFSGTDSVQVRARDVASGQDGPPATITFEVAPVNDAPSLALAPLAPHAPRSTGARTVPAFATFDAGPADEDATQALAGYDIAVLDDAGGVLAAAPTLDPDGTLHYALTGAAGTALVRVVARDDGGTADGGVDVSAAQEFSVEVEAGVDLHVAKDNGVDALADGAATVYRIVVENRGGAAATGVRIADVLPPSLADAHWACVPAASTIACPAPAAGSGDLAVEVDLPPGAAIAYDLAATVREGTALSVSNTASAQASQPDLDEADNQATDEDALLPFAIFGDGFEPR